MNHLRDTQADKAKDLIGKGRPGREQQGKGTQEHCSATCLAVSGYMVMGLLSGLSLAYHLAWHIFGLTQVPPGGKRISKPRWTPVQRILGGW